MGEQATIEYRFEHAEQQWQWQTTIDAEYGFQPVQSAAALPNWVSAEAFRCGHCRLAPGAPCPVAANLARSGLDFASLASYDEVQVSARLNGHVETRCKTSAQQAFSSIVGLIVATSSACVSTHLLKPMAMYHRPFASQEESIYRSIANAALFYQQTQPNESFAAFVENRYQELHELNVNLVARIRDQHPEYEALVNALVNLDTFVKGVIYNAQNAFPDLVDIGLPQ